MLVIDQSIEERFLSNSLGKFENINSRLHLFDFDMNTILNFEQNEQAGEYSDTLMKNRLPSPIQNSTSEHTNDFHLNQQSTAKTEQTKDTA